MLPQSFVHVYVYLRDIPVQPQGCEFPGKYSYHVLDIGDIHVKFVPSLPKQPQVCQFPGIGHITVLI